MSAFQKNPVYKNRQWLNGLQVSHGLPTPGKRVEMMFE
jgi:hypothetical protein